MESVSFLLLLLFLDFLSLLVSEQQESGNITSEQQKSGSINRQLLPLLLYTIRLTLQK